MSLRPLARVVPARRVPVRVDAPGFLVVTLLTVVFSELLPKALTLRYVPVVATLTAVPVLQIRRAVSPLVWVMNKLANAVTRPLGLGGVEAMEEEGHTPGGGGAARARGGGGRGADARPSGR